MNYGWNRPTEIIQKVVKNGRSKAMFVATKMDNDVLIGYSMCHPRDKWDKFTAIKIAFSRAYVWYESKRDWKIPHSLRKDFGKFLYRCRKYYKGANISVKFLGQEFDVELDPQIPFTAIGNDELSDIPCRKGDIVIFTHNDGTEEECAVKYGKDAKTDQESPMLSFIKLQNGQTYLVGIDGKFLGKNKSIRMKG